MTVLIADDNARFRSLLATLVEGTACVVSEATNGMEAVEQYRRHQPDWVLMDIRMAHLDGLRATAQIVALDPKARVLIVSQYDDDQTRAAAHDAGAMGFISKENIAEILTFLGPGPGPGAGAEQPPAFKSKPRETP